MASLTDVFFWRSEKSLKNVSFYSPNRLMFTRNWSKTSANECSKPIEDFCSIYAFAEREKEEIILILILRLMTVTTKQRLITKVTATTPTEIGVTKPTSRTMSVEQYSKRIWTMHTKRSCVGNETCLWCQVVQRRKSISKITWET